MSSARWFYLVFTVLTLGIACSASSDGGISGSGGTSSGGCPSGQTECNGACVDVASDAQNCGACGTACVAGSSCLQGTCSCQGGLTACSGGCVDVASDAQNCGSCGTACAVGQTCNGGTCTCPGNGTSCTGACVDVSTDAQNCGACGTACQTGQSCTSGNCACLGGLSLCGSSCVDEQSDGQNCGSCGHACTTGQVCSNGTCGTQCTGNQTQCGTDCVDITSNVANCGACGKACAAGQSCAGSTCTCPQGRTLCGSSCIDVTNDASNCGSCGKTCSAGQVCVSGACACGTSGQLLCGTACTNVQTDPANCGACGVTCGGGTTCSAGNCICTGGQTLCGSACTNLQTDGSNCGKCGTVCATGATCSAGSCTGGGTGGTGGSGGTGGATGGTGGATGGTGGATGGSGGTGGSTGGTGGTGGTVNCDFYVATNGNDSNSGTSIGSPFKTVGRAQTAASAGKLVCIRGGTYAFTGSGTVGVSFTKAGSANNLIKYWAYPGETPVFDLTNLTPSNRVTGLDVHTSYIHLKGLEVMGVHQYQSGQDSWGVRIQGSNNILELLNVHNNDSPGVFITSGANNLILNCDSHNNYDFLESGGSGDGFGCHSSGGNNILRGCRSYDNSDDGFDFINAAGSCIVQQSFSFRNGYVPGTTTTAGNGAGFKAGGYGSPPTVPSTGAATHTVEQCVAFGNRSQGFYANHHPGRINFYDNTAFRNPTNYNMLADSGFPSSHEIHNNIAMTPGTAISNFTGGNATNNSWQLSVTVSSADFASMDETLALAPRQADGSPPNNNFMRLVTGSDLIDKGIDVGLPFNGSAPDLGAFEH